MDRDLLSLLSCFGLFLGLLVFLMLVLALAFFALAVVALLAFSVLAGLAVASKSELSCAQREGSGQDGKNKSCGNSATRHDILLCKIDYTRSQISSKFQVVKPKK